MGDVKNNMSSCTEKGKKLLNKVLPEKKRTEDTAQTFVDKLADTYELLEKLIAVKTQDLASENNNVEYNQKQLAKLKTMFFHLDEVVSLINLYNKEA